MNILCHYLLDLSKKVGRTSIIDEFLLKKFTIDVIIAIMAFTSFVMLHLPVENNVYLYYIEVEENTTLLVSLN